jgi:RNA polymerase primary sigma factor
MTHEPGDRELIERIMMGDHRVALLLQALDPRTRDVILMRNGIGGSAKMTLEQLGRRYGITKERVRQINVRGMKQLREKAAQEKVELP